MIRLCLDLEKGYLPTPSRCTPDAQAQLGCGSLSDAAASRGNFK
jgi:hypothetical protein